MEVLVMKYVSLCLLALVLVTPGCLRRKKTDKVSVHSDARQGKKERKRVYDEELGAFVLEDDAEYDIFNQEPTTKEDAKRRDELAWEHLQQADEEDVVRFGYDSTAVKPEEMPKIERNVARLKERLAQDPHATVTVVGHSCKITKSERYNDMIAQRRAENLAKEYRKRGIPAKNIKAVGRGATLLVDENPGEEHQKVNRRAETVIVRA